MTLCVDIVTVTSIWAQRGRVGGWEGAGAATQAGRQVGRQASTRAAPLLDFRLRPRGHGVSPSTRLLSIVGPETKVAASCRGTGREACCTISCLPGSGPPGSHACAWQGCLSRASLGSGAWHKTKRIGHRRPQQRPDGFRSTQRDQRRGGQDGWWITPCAVPPGPHHRRHIVLFPPPIKSMPRIRFCWHKPACTK